ncbi:BatA and WFA domain-containing protein [Clostridium sp. SYSU_GA19001]|uniref:vWA domain-containing protein n=1 Tax=Clostridium caldaquaticum TaxID=2940653 RepID=UPI002076F600|nr:BatA and WFA domain-containing protein [Clostridium caldaquaticum]MCM8711783.1 BatA and WFA domain-containing protein [Clostridium caldaquaticum]
MRLLYPAALFFLISIPVIIAMYILKQKFEERKISSLYLWNQVIKDIDVNTPWQRLKSSLPLILQIILALLLTLALTDPFLLIKGRGEQNIIIVIDTTGSMKAAYEDSTKFEEGIKRAEKLIRSLRTGSKITLISSGSKPRIEISLSENKEDAINKLKNIKITNAAGDINDSLSLVKSISKQDKGYRSIFFTDKNVDIKGINGEVQVLNSYSENVSLDYISHSKSESGINAIIRINNRSSNSQKREVALYAEEKLFFLKDVELKPKEVKTIYFAGLPNYTKYLHGEISKKDSLNEDNSIYEVVKSTKGQKVLLVSERNVFIEKVLASLNNIELYKTNSFENIMDKYDLYIFDGVSPKALPKEGAVLFLNPPEDSESFKVNGDIDGGLGEAVKSSITKYMENVHFTVSKFKNIEVPYWASVFLKVNNKPAGFVGELKGQKTGVLAFDLHSSDFPLISEFPIFMHNLISYLTDFDFQTKSSYKSGESITINSIGDIEKLSMKSPSGSSKDIEVKYPIKPYENTDEIGIYRLTQSFKGDETERLFAVNFPSEKESDIDTEDKTFNNAESNSILNSSGINLKSFLVTAALLILMAEWMVYVYGY